MKNYYIADLHLGHVNALLFDERKFSTIQEQDEVVIENINKTVTKQDNLFLLGDVSWYNPQKTKEIIERIECKNRFLILGNHDRWAKDGACKKLFQGIYTLKRVQDEDKIVILCHYPIAVWDMQHRGSYHIYGHVHRNKSNDRMSDEHKILNHPEMENAFNVGCMLPYMDYTPRTLNELISFSKQTNK